MSATKFSDKTINVRVPHKMREAIDDWGQVKGENISVIVREALRIGLLKLGVTEFSDGNNKINNR